MCLHFSFELSPRLAHPGSAARFVPILLVFCPSRQIPATLMFSINSELLMHTFPRSPVFSSQYELGTGGVLAHAFCQPIRPACCLRAASRPARRDIIRPQSR